MATYQGKTVTLNKPSRITNGEPGYGRKKSKVYVKAKGGRFAKERFVNTTMKNGKTKRKIGKELRIDHKEKKTKKTTPNRTGQGKPGKWKRKDTRKKALPLYNS